MTNLLINFLQIICELFANCLQKENYLLITVSNNLCKIWMSNTTKKKLMKKYFEKVSFCRKHRKLAKHAQNVLKIIIRECVLWQKLAQEEEKIVDLLKLSTHS